MRIFPVFSKFAVLLKKSKYFRKIPWSHLKNLSLMKLKLQFRKFTRFYCIQYCAIYRARFVEWLLQEIMFVKSLIIKEIVSELLKWWWPLCWCNFNNWLRNTVRELRILGFWATSATLKLFFGFFCKASWKFVTMRICYFNVTKSHDQRSFSLRASYGPATSLFGPKLNIGKTRSSESIRGNFKTELRVNPTSPSQILS